MKAKSMKARVLNVQGASARMAAMGQFQPKRSTGFSDRNAPKADLERRPAQISSARPTIRGDDVEPVSVRRSLEAVYIGQSVRG